MPASQPDNREPAAEMFLGDANPRHPQRLRQFFLRSRPYRGELPTVAGFLLYPDAPAKLETTSREAFCPRPVPQQDRGKGSHNARSTHQESHRPLPTSSRQTGRGNSSGGDREPGQDERKGNRGETGPTAMQTQYQEDFPPPSSCRRRRTPALPQRDNLGINPAFRIEFSTVQRETYPGWPVQSHGYAGGPRAASDRQHHL